MHKYKFPSGLENENGKSDLLGHSYYFNHENHLTRLILILEESRSNRLSESSTSA